MPCSYEARDPDDEVAARHDLMADVKQVGRTHTFHQVYFYADHDCPHPARLVEIAGCICFDASVQNLLVPTRAVIEETKRMQQNPENLQYTPAQNHSENPKRRVFFGRVWSETQTTLFLFGIPAVCKEKTRDRDVLRLIGIPVIKTYYDTFDKKTRFLGVPVSIRPNYRYLEQRISDSINCLNMLPGAPTKLRSNQSELVTLAEARAILRKLPSYQLMCDLKEGRLLLEDELTIVTHQMEKLLAPEGKIDG
ncbi:MAG: hypothetical protein ABFC56_06570 [Clostridiaceae bacterium]